MATRIDQLERSLELAIKVLKTHRAYEAIVHLQPVLNKRLKTTGWAAPLKRRKQP